MAAVDHEVELLEQEFPNWDVDVQTPEFEHWITHQSAHIQLLCGSPLASDAAMVLNLYHARGVTRH